MPNWCVGYLRIKGDYEDIVTFLEKDLDLPTGGNEEDIRVSRYDDDSGIELEIKHYGAHIRGTRRGFIDPVYRDFYRTVPFTVIALEARFAWEIDVEGLRHISKERRLNFRIYAFEQGVQFNRDIEILEGRVTKNETITFDDYDWECISPYAGG